MPGASNPVRSVARLVTHTCWAMKAAPPSDDVRYHRRIVQGATCSVCNALGVPPSGDQDPHFLAKRDSPWLLGDGGGLASSPNLPFLLIFTHAGCMMRLMRPHYEFPGMKLDLFRFASRPFATSCFPPPTAELVFAFLVGGTLAGSNISCQYADPDPL